MKERLKSALQRIFLRLAGRCEPPYQCYWRDRALRAECELAALEAERAAYRGLW